MLKNEGFMIAGLSIIFNLLCLAFGVIMSLDAFQTNKANTNLKNKVDFYESVITDFGTEEFVKYPNIWYNNKYRSQIKNDTCLDILG